MYARKNCAYLHICIRRELRIEGECTRERKREREREREREGEGERERERQRGRERGTDRHDTKWHVQATKDGIKQRNVFLFEQCRHPSYT